MRILIFVLIIILVGCDSEFQRVALEDRSLSELFDNDIFSPIPLTDNAGDIFSQPGFLNSLKESEKDGWNRLWKTYTNQYGLVKFDYTWHKSQGPAHFSTAITLELNQSSQSDPIKPQFKRQLNSISGNKKLWISDKENNWGISIIRSNGIVEKIILFLEESDTI